MGVADHIKISARDWTSVQDFYNAVFKAVKAPQWHGASIDALIDSMIWGGINERKPPYVVEILGLDDAPIEIRKHVETFSSAFETSKAEFMATIGHSCDVSVMLA